MILFFKSAYSNYYKTQWEQLSSSRSHSSTLNFFTFEVRLRLCGWLYRPVPPACAFIICFNNLRLLGSAYYSITFKLSIRYSFRFTFPDGAFFGLRLLQNLSTSSQTLWNLRFSPFSIPEYFGNFCHLHPPLVNPTAKESSSCD